MPCVDKSGGGGDEPYVGGFAVVPSDTSDLPILPRALWIGMQGDITMKMLDGPIITLFAVPIGRLKVRPTRVYATGTSAADITGLY